MTRQISVGGNGSLDQLVFAPFCGIGQDRDALLTVTRRLLKDDDYYRSAVNETTETAKRLVSYEQVAEELRSFYASIGD